MNTTSLALVLLAALQLGIVGCDHLRAKDASAEQNTKSSEKTSAAPASMVPPSDRYATTGGEQH